MDIVKEEKKVVKQEEEPNPSRKRPKGKARLIRFGDSMIPTPGGRGANLSDIKSSNLGKAMTAAVMDRQIKDRGFLCNDETIAVPDGYREWEEERTEIYRMKGEMLQLKKIIKRQELAKSLTEKALTAAEGFREKQQEEMNEIKTDLDELRGKCSEELRELGITEEKAKAVLMAKLMDNSPEEPAPEKPKKKAKPASNQFGANRASKRKKANGRGRGKVRMNKTEKKKPKSENRRCAAATMSRAWRGTLMHTPSQNSAPTATRLPFSPLLTHSLPNKRNPPSRLASLVAEVQQLPRRATQQPPRHRGLQHCRAAAGGPAQPPANGRDGGGRGRGGGEGPGEEGTEERKGGG
jgi:hypothetical protein